MRGASNRKGAVMSLPEIAVWIAVLVIMVFRIAMLGLFVALPVVIVKAIRRQSAA